MIIATLSTFFAVKGKHQLYWIAALGIYIFSFIAGFSIGQITVGLTFLPLALAVGYSLNLIKNGLSFTIFLGIGFLVGLIMVFFVDDFWLFFPFLILNGCVSTINGDDFSLTVEFKYATKYFL